MAAALDHVYRYAYPSSLDTVSPQPEVRLATSGGPSAFPFLFRGQLRDARVTADLLLAVVRVVRSRFHIPPAMLARILREADPVVTCTVDRLRFEGFSACCGVYARLDLLPGAVDGSLMQCGTTNVDFNPPMRAALTQIRDGEPVGLSVGTDAVELERAGESVVERRVPLPVRWLKGFSEVQVIQADLAPRLEVSGAEARRFLRSLPRGGSGSQSAWVVGGRNALRLSQVRSPGAVRLAGVERLRVLEEVIRHASLLRIYTGDRDESSAWELTLPNARFYLVLSPEIWRGFSGEGGLLHTLAGTDAEPPAEATTQVLEAMGWDGFQTPQALSASSKQPLSSVRSVLARLAAGGRVGFDLSEGAYFRRELPFDLGAVETLQPRLVQARALVASDGVRLEPGGDRLEAWVRGTGVEHRVRLEAEGARCSCPWWGRHRGERGPCKHILAVQLAVDDASAEGNGR